MNALNPKIICCNPYDKIENTLICLDQTYKENCLTLNDYSAPRPDKKDLICTFLDDKNERIIGDSCAFFFGFTHHLLAESWNNFFNFIHPLFSTQDNLVQTNFVEEKKLDIQGIQPVQSFSTMSLPENTISSINDNKRDNIIKRKSFRW